MPSVAPTQPGQGTVATRSASSRQGVNATSSASSTAPAAMLATAIQRVRVIAPAAASRRSLATRARAPPAPGARERDQFQDDLQRRRQRIAAFEVARPVPVDQAG